MNDGEPHILFYSSTIVFVLVGLYTNMDLRITYQFIGTFRLNFPYPLYIFRQSTLVHLFIRDKQIAGKEHDSQNVKQILA